VEVYNTPFFEHHAAAVRVMDKCSIPLKWSRGILIGKYFQRILLYCYGCELQPFGRWKVIINIYRTHCAALSFDHTALATTFPSVVCYIYILYYNIICIYRLQWHTEGEILRIRSPLPLHPEHVKRQINRIK